MRPAPWGFALALSALILLSPALARALNRGADGHFDERRSVHFRLLQDVAIDHVTGATGSRRFERDVIQVLESAFRTVRKTVNLQPRRRIDVVIYDSGVFEEQYGSIFRFRAAGFYNGVIHVRAGVSVDQRLTRTLYHEYFHAAFDSVTAPGQVPGWLNEGLAQWFERRAVGAQGLSPLARAQLAHAHRSGSWLPYELLSRPTFAGLDEDAAGMAYLQSYAMVEHLVRRHGERRLRSFIRHISRGLNVERLLEREFRVSPEELERDLRAELN